MKKSNTTDPKMKNEADHVHQITKKTKKAKYQNKKNVCVLDGQH